MRTRRPPFVTRLPLGPVPALLLGALMLAVPILAAPILAVWDAGPAGAADAPAFVAGTEDLPLMPGLSPVPDSGVVFQTGQGRIVEAFARGDVTAAAVGAFYARTLTHLGWRPAADGTGFRREGEALRIEVLPGPAPVTVRFHIAPSP